MAVADLQRATFDGIGYARGYARATGDASGGLAELTLYLPDIPGARWRTLRMTVGVQAAVGASLTLYRQWDREGTAWPTTVVVMPPLGTSPITAGEIAAILDTFRFIVQLPRVPSGTPQPFFYLAATNNGGVEYILAWEGVLESRLGAPPVPAPVPEGTGVVTRLRGRVGGLLTEV